MAPLRLGAACLVGGLPAVVWPGAIADAAAAGVTGASDPALLAYVATPLVVLSAAILFLAPGLILSRCSPVVATAPIWMLRALPIALLVNAVIITLARALPVGWSVGTWSLVFIVLATIATTMLDRCRPSTSTVGDGHDALTAGSVAVAIVIGMVVLAPKVLWESFNGDGAHAFEASRLLLSQPWPFFPVDAGAIAAFPGPTSVLFAWPNAWFLMLFGPVDAAARIPFLIYVPLLVVGIQAVAEEGGRRLEGASRAVLWLGIVPFVLAMAYSASYEPYHADLALPGVQDLLLLVCLLGFIHAMIRRDVAWILVFALLCHLSLPNGLVLIGFWLVAEVLVMRPLPWRALATGAMAVAVCLMASMALPAIVAATGAPVPGDEYGIGRAITDLLRVNPTEWQRLVWVLVGAGIVPAFLLLAWRRLDDVSRRVALLTAAYFLFFHVQARVSLHHFAPAMVLPLIVALRVAPADPARRRVHLSLWAAGAVVAIVLAAPRSFAIDTSTRDVGRTISQQAGSYHDGDPDVFRAAERLSAVFLPAWDARVPDEGYGASPLALIRYAASGAVTDSTTYLLTADSLVIVDSVRDETLRRLRPRTDTRAPILQVPRATLYGPGGPGTVDLRERFLGGTRP